HHLRKVAPSTVGAGLLAEVADQLASVPLRRMSQEPLTPYLPDPARAPDVSPGSAPIRAALKKILIEVRETRREVRQMRREGLEGSSGPALSWVASTPAYESAVPRVTVGISLHDYEDEVGEALASIAASDYDDYEAVGVDDASADRSAGAGEHFLADRPWMPA